MVLCLRLTDMPSMKLQRRVLPERLDVMPADDPLARRSRCDLQRVHRVMRSLTILRRAIGMLCMTRQPRRILELGAGDLAAIEAAFPKPGRDEPLAML